MNKSLVSTLNDTLSIVAREDLLDFYKDIASVQSDQFTILLTVILGVFTAVIGATWWWNYKGAKSQINDEMSVAKKEIQNLSDELLGKFNAFKLEIQEQIRVQTEETIDSHLSIKLDEYSKQIEHIDRKNEEQLNEFQEKVNNKITEHQAELARVFALHCDSMKAFYNAFSWWLSAFEWYNKINEGNLAQVSIKAALAALKNVKKEQVNKEDLDGYAKRIRDNVPDILSSERKEILSLLEKLKQPEQNNV